MSIREISFPSANGENTIKAWAYTPLGKPKGIVQIIHGYGEHSRRYLHMIGAFNAAGFIVVADDHLGHGKTGFDEGMLGKSHSGGYMTYVKDEKTLHDIAVTDYPGLPFFVFGHSWGSMLARAYAAYYGEDVKGLMLCGVACQMQGADEAYANPELKAAYLADRDAPGAPWFGRVFTGLMDRIENPTGGNDWIANNPDIVADHAADMFNCFDTRAGLRLGPNPALH